MTVMTLEEILHGFPFAAFDSHDYAGRDLVKMPLVDIDWL